MTISLCIRCGAKKFGAVRPCGHCDHAPHTQREMAYSLALSDHYFDHNTLTALSSEIARTGQIPNLPHEQEERFLSAVAEDQNMQILLHFNQVRNSAAEAMHAVPSEAFQLISQLPLYIFIAVAGADGRIDRKEVETFQKLMVLSTAAQLFKSPLFQALVVFGENAGSETSLSEASLEWFENGFATNAAHLVRQHCPRRERSEFAADVHTLAVAIGNASGGLFGFGNKLSRSEREVISELASLFSTSTQNPAAETSIVKFAQEWLNTFEHTFENAFGLDADSAELAAYVVSILDASLQMHLEEGAYKRQISTLINTLSRQVGLAPGDLVDVVRHRAKAYSDLTFRVIDEFMNSEEERKVRAGVQLAWELYANAAHRNPRGHMIQLIALLVPRTVEFTLMADKLVGSHR